MASLPASWPGLSRPPRLFYSVPPAPLFPRFESELPCEALRVDRPHLGIDLSRHRLAVERIEHLFGSDFAHVEPRLAGDAGGVRTDEDIVELQQWVIARRRFGRPDVKTCAGQPLLP